MTIMCDGTKNVLSKEDKSTIFTFTHLSLQEAMTESGNISRSLQMPLMPKVWERNCKLFVTTKLQALLCNGQFGTVFSVSQGIFCVSQLESDLKSYKLTHDMGIKCRPSQHSKKDREKSTIVSFTPAQVNRRALVQISILLHIHEGWERRSGSTFLEIHKPVVSVGELHRD